MIQVYGVSGAWALVIFKHFPNLEITEPSGVTELDLSHLL